MVMTLVILTFVVAISQGVRTLRISRRELLASTFMGCAMLVKLFRYEVRWLVCRLTDAGYRLLGHEPPAH